MSYHKITLERDGFNQPWGFRMIGGSDVGTALSVARVTAGTASEGYLKVGDIITDISGQEACRMTHQEASDRFTDAGNRITINVARGVPATSLGRGVSSVDGYSDSSKRPTGLNQTASDKSNLKAISMGEFISTKSTLGNNHPIPSCVSPAMKSAPSYLPLSPLTRCRTPVNDNLPEYDEDEKCMIQFQPYRTTPLITPGAKVKRDHPINSSYLSLHPDPQVRGRARHMQVNPTLDSMLNQANNQLAIKVANNVRVAADNLSNYHRTDSGPKVVHHQFNTPINLYSPGNAAQSLNEQTGLSTAAVGRDQQFSIQNSEALKAIMEDNTDGARQKQKPKSHVHYDLHEAKGGVWPPPDYQDQRVLPPSDERPVRKYVELPKRELPCSPTQDNPFSGSRTVNEKISQSYSFNKVMWAMDPLEKM